MERITQGIHIYLQAWHRMAARIALVFFLKRQAKDGKLLLAGMVSSVSLAGGSWYPVRWFRAGSSHSGFVSNGAVLSPERNTMDVHLQSMAL